MVYTLYFILLIFGALIVKGKRGNNHYLFGVMTFLFLIIGLRDVSVGADTLSYTEDFFYFYHKSFSEIWNHACKSKEPLYILISWFPSLYSDSYTSYLLTWALFPTFSLYWVFKAELQDGKDILIALLVFFLLGLFAFYVAGIRQTAALSIVFAGARCLRNFSWNGFKKLIFNRSIYTFFLAITIAYMIHNSSILFVLAIPCLFFQVRWWYLLLVLGLFFISKFVQLDAIIMLSKFFFEERFDTYGTVYESSQNVSALIMQVILFLVCFVVKGKLIKNDSYNNFFLNMMFLGLVFQSLSELMAEMARVSFYFSMFAMILVPKAFREYPKDTKLLSYAGFVVISIFYLFFITSSNLPKYHSVL